MSARGIAVLSKGMRPAWTTAFLLATASCAAAAGGAAGDAGLAAPDGAVPVEAGSSTAPAAGVADGGSDAPTDASHTIIALDIPAREQWLNGGGYCGETSIQSIALFYGAWISQAVVRAVAGGEVLLGVNDAKALDALHLSHVDWSVAAPKPQFESFMQWMKGQLAHGAPCIFGVYLTDGTNDPDYDHILPATGVEFTNGATYDPGDQLTLNDNFGDRITRAFGTLSGSRASCASSSVQGGCVPANVDYGTAVTGIVDTQHVTLPVTASVSGTSEPNVSTGAAASPMTATVTVSGLQAGSNYALLRYDDRTVVPTDAAAGAFLSSAYTYRTDFTATQATWTLADAHPFSSDGATYYRCVPRP